MSHTIRYLKSAAGTTETSLVMLGGLLNGFWEFLQSPLYTDHINPWGYLIWTRLHCTAGDVLILLCAFWLTSLLHGSRHWIARQRLSAWVVFVLAGFLYTIYSEWYNTQIRVAWQYTESMPTIVGIGLTPLLQWLVIPPTSLVVLRRWHSSNK